MRAPGTAGTVPRSPLTPAGPPAGGAPPRGAGRPAVAPPAWKPPRPGGPGMVRPGGAVLELRRRPGLPVRRRRRWLGLAKHFAVAVLLVGTPAVALWWSATSPRFDLARLEVETTERVNRRWVEERLDHLLGRNLVWMSMHGVERSLAGHPWVGGVEVFKNLPDRLRVEVAERRPVALLQTDGGRHYVDRQGRLIAPVEGPEAPPAEAGRVGEYLILREAWRQGGDGGRESTAEREATLGRALRAAQALSRVEPRWGAALVEIEILGADDFVLHSRELPFPLLVEAGTVEQRAEAFRRALPRILERVPTPAGIDLRFENRMVVRPAADELARGASGRGEPHGQAG